MRPHLEQGVDLPQLDVVELGVGVDVRVGHAQQLPLARPHGRYTAANERYVMFQSELLYYSFQELKASRFQHGSNTGSTRVQHGFNTGSTRVVRCVVPRPALGGGHPGLLQCFQHHDERHVVLHQPVERILLLRGPAQALHQRQRRLVELHLVFLDEREAVLLEEDRAPFNQGLASHWSGPPCQFNCCSTEAPLCTTR